MEVDLLEFDDWNDNYSWSTFNAENLETQIVAKLASDDYFIKKQTLSEALIYLQNPKSSDAVRIILNAIKGLSSDYESSLRLDLSESLTTIHRLLDSVSNLNSSDWSFITNFVIPIISTFLQDPNKQVRTAAHAALVHFVEEKYLNEELFLEHFLESLRELMDSCNPDELRSECFQLLVQLSALLNNCFEAELIEYSNDFIKTNDALRKTCASYLCNIIKNSTSDHIKDWLEVFYKLAEDNSWYVRKFCIESACVLSKEISPEERWNKMAETYYSFMVDSKKWVFTAALQNLGEFLATFADSSKTHCHIENGHIVNKYNPSLKCSDPPKSDNDEEDNKSCAKAAALSKENDTANSTSSGSSNNLNNFSTFSYWRQPVDTKIFTDELIDAMNSINVADNDKAANNASHNGSISSENGVANLTSKQTIVPEKLVMCYIKTILEYEDVDVLRPCAFSMPAVLYTLGPECWSYMGPAYFHLLQSMSWKVRLSLASSIHHIFEIFQHSPDAVNDLISVYKEFIKDVDEIKVGLMENVSCFFLALPISRYPDVFDDICDLLQLESVKNWRYRVSGMKQLGQVITKLELSGLDDWSVFIPIFRNRWVPLVFQFINDNVCAVRISAVNVLLQMLTRIHSWFQPSNSHCTSSTIDIPTQLIDIQTNIFTNLLSLSESPLWCLRQLFLQCTTQIIILLLSFNYNSSSSCSSSLLDSPHNNENGDSSSLARIVKLLFPRYLVLCTSDTVANNRMVGGQGIAVMLNNKDAQLIKFDDDFMLSPDDVDNHDNGTEDDDNDDINKLSAQDMGDKDSNRDKPSQNGGDTTIQTSIRSSSKPLPMITNEIRTSIIYTCRKLCIDSDRDVRDSVKSIKFLEKLVLHYNNNHTTSNDSLIGANNSHNTSNNSHERSHSSLFNVTFVTDNSQPNSEDVQYGTVPMETNDTDDNNENNENLIP